MLLEPFNAEELGADRLLGEIGKNGGTVLEDTDDIALFWQSGFAHRRSPIVPRAPPWARFAEMSANCLAELSSLAQHVRIILLSSQHGRQ